MTLATDLIALAARAQALEDELTVTLATLVELKADQGSAERWADDFAGDWRTRWNVGSANGQDHAEPTPDGLKVNIPKGALGVMGFHASPFGPAQHVILRAQVTFGSTFRFLNGGKLFGLGASLSWPNGPRICAGGKRWNDTVEVTKSNLGDADSCSVKILHERDGRASLYLYAVSPVGPSSTRSYYGKTIPGTTAAKFDLTATNTLELEVAMNTPGVADGIASLRLNDVQVARSTSVQWRSAKRPHLSWSQILGNFQFGGGSADAATADMEIVYSGFSVERVA